jgi:hypothetical protein
MLLCIEVATEAVVNCLPRGICCRWCLVITEAVTAIAHVGDDVVVLIFAKAKAVAVEALDLASKRYLWLASALLTLLFLARFDAA